jgi:hypothetical protein
MDSRPGGISKAIKPAAHIDTQKGQVLPSITHCGNCGRVNNQRIPSYRWNGPSTFGLHSPVSSGVQLVKSQVRRHTAKHPITNQSHMLLTSSDCYHELTLCHLCRSIVRQVATCPASVPNGLLSASKVFCLFSPCALSSHHLVRHGNVHSQILCR